MGPAPFFDGRSCTENTSNRNEHLANGAFFSILGAS